MVGVKEHFREGLGAKIRALDIARRNLTGRTHPDEDDESAESIRRIAHSLLGSGTTYGFPRISAAARKVEEAGPGELRARLDELLVELRVTATGHQMREVAILVAASDPLDLGLIRTTLEGPNRRLIVTPTAAEASRKLSSEHLDLAVIDLVLSDGDGRNLLMRIRDEPGTVALPILVVSSLMTDQVRAECLALGAQQFIEKPINPDVLGAGVAAALQRAATAAERSLHDPLTKLRNRAAFVVAFEHARAVTSRTGRRYSVAILDLDRFKAVNDRHGHAVGDEVLRRSAGVISDRLRKSDILARWGGEEFVALFEDTGEEGAAKALDYALEQLRRQRFVGPDGTEFSVTFSAGVTELRPERSLAEVLTEADRYLYLAKAAGRRRVFHSTSQPVVPKRNILLVEDDDTMAEIIRCELATDRFQVFLCRNAEEALQRIEELDVELGILDVNMPGMDGFSLLGRFRAMPTLSKTPIVMLTGRGSAEDILRGFELGADDYVVKPFSPVELQARVRRLLNRS